MVAYAIIQLTGIYPSEVPMKYADRWLTTGLGFYETILTRNLYAQGQHEFTISSDVADVIVEHIKKQVF